MRYTIRFFHPMRKSMPEPDPAKAPAMSPHQVYWTQGGNVRSVGEAVAATPGDAGWQAGCSLERIGAGCLLAGCCLQAAEISPSSTVDCCRVASFRF
eukprot:COSAG01_NODE_2302_length_7952_cov_8.079078_7_plen_97_part_00